MVGSLNAADVIDQPPAPDFNADIDVRYESFAILQDLLRPAIVDFRRQCFGFWLRRQFECQRLPDLLHLRLPLLYENGRRYHACHDGKYVLPNDEAEQNRLDLQHYIFGLTLGGRLFRAPIFANPKRVLNFGTGTGIWAVNFADEFPGATVMGTGLSHIQPDLALPKLRFYVDDVKSE